MSGARRPRSRSVKPTIVEIIDLRHFASADLRPLLTAECEAWQAQLDWDYTGSCEMVLRYVDSKILPGLAALERGRIFGYTYFVFEGSKGVIGDLFVDGDTDGASSSAGSTVNRAAEQRLLTQVIETLQNSSSVQRVETQLLMYKTGTAAEPFVRAGFARHARLFMALSLHGITDSAPRPLPPELAIRPWGEMDFQGVAMLIRAAYQGHVDAEINDQYQTVSGSLRFLNNIIRFPGCGTFDAEASYLAVHREQHTVVGVVLCSTIRADVGHITQICVLPEYRGQGVGEALMAQSAMNLKRRAFTQISLTVTEANRGAVALYQRIGFSTRRMFDAFVWNR